MTLGKNGDSNEVAATSTNRLGKELTTRVVLVSALFMFFISLGQLLLEFQGLRHDLDTSLDSITTYVNSLERSVWSFDNDQIELFLESTHQLPNIVSAEIVTLDKTPITWKTDFSEPPKYPVVRVVPLYAEEGNELVTIANLTVVADLSQLYSHIISRGLVILLTNGLKTFFVVLFMLYLFRTRVINRVLSIDGRVKEIKALLFRNQNVPTASDDNRQTQHIHPNGDELDQLSDTLNQTISELAILNRDRIASQKAIEESANHTQNILNSVSDVILAVETSGKIVSANVASETLFGLPQDELIGLSITTLLPDADLVFNSDKDKGPDQLDIFTQARLPNGMRVSVAVSVTSSSKESRNLYICLIRDRTSELESIRKIEHLAYFDQLTGLANRQRFMEQLTHTVSVCGRTKNWASMIFVDLDNFKMLNDSQGHEAGDLLLAELAKRLKNTLRRSDLVARFGGDEFLVLLENLEDKSDTAANYAAMIANKILGVFQQHFSIGGRTVQATASLGVVIFNSDDLSAEQLLAHADLAMYSAKEAGRNTYRFYDVELQRLLELHIELEQDMRTGLDRGEFHLVFQPQVKSDGVIIGAEALLRWQHPTRGLVPPDIFIPIAERSDVILLLGDFVLQNACQVLHQWQLDAQYQSMCLSINVSINQFQQTDFVSHVIHSIQKHDINPSSLKVEITESIFETNIEKLIEQLNALRDAGLKLSLDDFGTGYSSLTYLKRLPIHELKVDRSFVQDISIDSDDASIVRTIILLGRSMQLEVIAEGVETVEQHQFLLNADCHRYQGYLFSKPLLLEDFFDFVSTH